MFIVAAGTLFDGFSILGPFETREEARAWMAKTDWYAQIAELEPGDEDATVGDTVLLAGNITDGFTAFGPFEDHGSAAEFEPPGSLRYAWTWVATLEDPA